MERPSPGCRGIEGSTCFGRRWPEQSAHALRRRHSEVQRESDEEDGRPLSLVIRAYSSLPAQVAPPLLPLAAWLKERRHQRLQLPLRAHPGRSGNVGPYSEADIRSARAFDRHVPEDMRKARENWCSLATEEASQQRPEPRQPNGSRKAVWTGSAGRMSHRRRREIKRRPAPRHAAPPHNGRRPRTARSHAIRHSETSTVARDETLPLRNKKPRPRPAKSRSPDRVR
jgi:hypothetical protein